MLLSTRQTIAVAILAVIFGRDVAAKPVQVFILAGQSNMEGKAKMSLLEYQATAPETKDVFQHLRQDDQWVVRDDVWIKFLDRHGKLTVGYGSPDCIGPELEFGWTMGDHHDAAVLIIKTAWGGKSLFRDFRPPSSGLPKVAVLEELLQRSQKRQPDTTLDDVKTSFGFYYREMLKEIQSTLTSLPDLFPMVDGQGYELAGFVWFQGWNDMINADYTAEYADNMANFIRDVRKDLQQPNLPFVIGQLGVDGTQGARPNPKRDAFKAAQIEPAERPEFKGNVGVVRTDQYWDMAADSVFRSGWKENLEQWNRVGSDRPYHYLGSARTYSQIGKAFAECLLDLRRKQRPVFYDPMERDVAGWRVKFDPKLVATENRDAGERAFEALANHLQRVKYIVSQDRLDALMQLPIWVELNNAELGAMQYHPDRGWLLAHGHDPRLVKHVHIPRAPQLYDPTMWAKHPYVVLHELAHAYHDQVLSFDERSIKGAYDDAKQEGMYDAVLLYTGKKVRHYGMTNHKEYFAESTEAYFGVNDFYPFVRAELREHDPRIFTILEEVWGPVKE
jgi:alpha-galactosidase